MTATPLRQVTRCIGRAGRPTIRRNGRIVQDVAAREALNGRCAGADRRGSAWWADPQTVAVILLNDAMAAGRTRRAAIRANGPVVSYHAGIAPTDPRALDRAARPMTNRCRCCWSTAPVPPGRVAFPKPLAPHQLAFAGGVGLRRRRAVDCNTFMIFRRRTDGQCLRIRQC